MSGARGLISSAPMLPWQIHAPLLTYSKALSNPQSQHGRLPNSPSTRSVLPLKLVLEVVLTTRHRLYWASPRMDTATVSARAMQLKSHNSLLTPLLSNRPSHPVKVRLLTPRVSGSMQTSTGPYDG